MTDSDKILVAQCELSRFILQLGNRLDLRDTEMRFAVVGALSEISERCLTVKSYESVTIAEKEKIKEKESAENGNTDEAGQ